MQASWLTRVRWTAHPPLPFEGHFKPWWLYNSNCQPNDIGRSEFPQRRTVIPRTPSIVLTIHTSMATSNKSWHGTWCTAQKEAEGLKLNKHSKKRSLRQAARIGTVVHLCDGSARLPEVAKSHALLRSLTAWTCHVGRRVHWPLHHSAAA